jgi:organic hydroperoxide reductase OsmC/OhrA
MNMHTAKVSWSAGGDDFASGKYSRVHEWSFDGGITVPASSAPQVIAPPLSAFEAVDPEEALVAAASSCHMLTFLYFAYRAGFIVESYVDDAVGEMAKNENGKVFMKRIVLKPKIRWGGPEPTADQLTDLNHKAHEDCYIANSILCEIVVEPN